VLDTARIRSRFPALGATHGGRPIVYADAPGGTQVPDSVIEAVAGWYRDGISNTHGAFPRSEATDRLIADAREAAADLLGTSAERIVFGQNATSLLFHLARAFARTIGPGDEVVVTSLDHDANVRPWLVAAADAGATARRVDVRDDDVTLDTDSLDAVLSDRTKLVAVTMASNAVGTITPVREVIARAHAVGALVVVDAVHAAQHLPVEMDASGADIAAVSAYKFFGPHVGMLAVRRELLEAWTPDRVRPAAERGPERWETGTQNHEGLAGTIAVIEYLADLGRTDGDPSDGTRRAAVAAAYRAIAQHERALAARFLEGVARLPHIELVGIADPGRVDERTPTFAIRCDGREPLEVAKQLADRGIWTWDGHYYAIELFERLGLLDTGGAVRIGFCHYHSLQEVERVLAALGELG